MKKLFAFVALRSAFQTASLSVACAFFAPIVAFAGQAVQAVTPVPVSKDMLDGTRLVLKSAGCSLDLPGPGWSWMTYDKSGQNYLCFNSKTYDVYMIGVGKLEHDLVPHQPESLIASAKKTQQERGGKIEDDKFEFVDTPGTKKSAKVTFYQVDKSKKSYVCVWLINTVDLALLKINCAAPGTSEPETFKTLIKSLKMLDAKK